MMDPWEIGFHGGNRITEPGAEHSGSDPAIIAGGVCLTFMEYLDDDDDFEDGEIPIFSGTGEGLMEEAPATGSGASRRNEDIALDLMKFIAMTTGYGRTTSSGVGFQGTGSASKPEDYATHLLELYGKCLGAVAAKK
jgi:hypothetical protein